MSAGTAAGGRSAQGDGGSAQSTDAAAQSTAASLPTADTPAPSTAAAVGHPATSPATPLSVTAADPATWPDACTLLSFAQVEAMRQGTYHRTSHTSQFAGGGPTPHMTECTYGDGVQGIFFSFDISDVESSPAAAHATFVADASGTSTPVPNLGDEAYYDGLGTVTVRQRSIVWTVSAFESAGLMEKDAATLAHQIAIELNR